MTKSVRVYYHFGPPARYRDRVCYPASRGIVVVRNIIRNVISQNFRISAVGCEEGAMVLHVKEGI